MLRSAVVEMRACLCGAVTDRATVLLLCFEQGDSCTCLTDSQTVGSGRSETGWLCVLLLSLCT